MTNTSLGESVRPDLGGLGSLSGHLGPGRSRGPFSPRRHRTRRWSTSPVPSGSTASTTSVPALPPDSDLRVLVSSKHSLRRRSGLRRSPVTKTWVPCPGGPRRPKESHRWSPVVSLSSWDQVRRRPLGSRFRSPVPPTDPRPPP